MSGETMREAVARAICEVDCGMVTENELDRCRDLADAAIRTVLERLREPSEAFLSSYGAEHRRTVAGIWESGIDAAVREVGLTDNYADN